MAYLLGDSLLYIMGDNAYSYTPEIDTTPDAFVLNSVTAADLFTTYTRETALTGIDAGEQVTVTNGQLSVNNGASWTSGPVNFVPGQTRVRSSITTGAVFGYTHSLLVTVNGVSSLFEVTTKANPTVAQILSINDGNPIAPGSTVQIQAVNVNWAQVVAMYLSDGDLAYPLEINGTDTVTVPSHIPSGVYALKLRLPT